MKLDLETKVEMEGRDDLDMCRGGNVDIMDKLC